MNTFEQRRQARIDRLQDRADRAKAEASRLSKRANEMASVIPLGQPILVGHHSEGRDRRYRAKVSNTYDKAYQMGKQAEELKRRAEAAARNTAIFSDDPDAQEKIEDKIKRLEERQAIMVTANRLVRKKDVDGLLAMGFSVKSVDSLFTPDFCGRLGFADYQLQNNSSNIRRLKERLKELQRKATIEPKETEVNGIRIVDNPDENRTQIFFPGKPAESIRAKLKNYGFRWSPTSGAWQRNLSDQARYWAEQVAKEVTN